MKNWSEILNELFKPFELLEPLEQFEQFELLEQFLYERGGVGDGRYET